MKKIMCAVISAFFILPAVVFAEDPAPQTPASEVITGDDEDPVKSRLNLGNDHWIQVHALIQTGFQSANTWNPAVGETKNNAYWSKDFYLRAARLIFNGQAAENVYFFLQTADLTAGGISNNQDTNTNATNKVHLYTQDAYLNFVALRFAQIYTGLLTIPFDRQNMQSQATLLGTERPKALNTMEGYTNNGRDLGIMLRGIGPGSHSFLEYRVGLFRGFNRDEDSTGTVTRNKSDFPRIAGRIQLNPGDPEEGYFYSENYLGKRHIFAIGAGMDFQPNVYHKTKDYLAFTGDVSFDIPFNQLKRFVLSGQAGFIKALNYPEDAFIGDTGAYTGYTIIYAQAGLLVEQKIQPWVRFYYRHNAGVTGDAHSSYEGFNVGFNYFINDHFANIKLSFDIPIGKNTGLPNEYVGTLQFQGYL
jgi:hypothetical protein